MAPATYVETAHCPKCQKSPLKLLSELRRPVKRTSGWILITIGIGGTLLGCIFFLHGAEELCALSVIGGLFIVFVGILEAYAKKMVYTEWVCDCCSAHYPYSSATARPCKSPAVSPSTQVEQTPTARPVVELPQSSAPAPQHGEIVSGHPPQ